MKILTFIMVFFSLNVIGRIKNDSIIGSWWFSFDNEYFEIHFCEGIIVRQDDFFGTQFVNYDHSDVIGKEIRIPTGELIKVLEVNGNKAKIELSDQGEFNLVRIEGLVIEPYKLRDNEVSFIREFYRVFELRKKSWEKLKE